MPFVTDLCTRATDQYRGGLRVVELTAPLVYWCHSLRHGTRQVHVPAGYRSDYASIPRFARPLIPSWGRWAEAAVVHDWIYSDGWDLFTRVEADEIFRAAMRDLGVAAWRRWLMWAAVRIGGFGGWNPHPLRAALLGALRPHRD